MKLRSSAESVSRREVSALACFECALSVSIYVFIAVKAETIAHYLVAVALAPLFLMRTRYSQALALGIWHRIWAYVLSPNSSRSTVFLVPLMPLIAVPLRFYATVVGLFRHPFLTLGAMPGNWFLQTLCWDVFKSPELVPGEERYHGEGVPTLAATFVGSRPILNEAVLQRSYFKLTIFITIVILPILILGYLPSLIVRISFKATSIIYFPLIWVAGATIKARMDLKLRLQRIVHGAMEKYRRVTAITIIVGMVPALVSANIEGLRSVIEESIGGARLAFFMSHLRSWWLWVVLFDAASTISLFLLADASLARLEAGALKSARTVLAAIKSLTFFRGTTAALTAIYVFSYAVAVSLGVLMNL